MRDARLFILPAAWRRRYGLAHRPRSASPRVRAARPCARMCRESWCDAIWRGMMPNKTTQKKTTEKAEAAGGGRANALQQPLRPSEALVAVVGPGPLPRGEVVSKMWEYIKANNLQNPENRREILADDKLKPIFGKPKVTMFEMNKHLAQHLK